jgi:hypothetical protein
MSEFESVMRNKADIRNVVKKKPALLRAFLYYQPRYPPPPKPKVTLGPP